jgi:predicted DNA-binding transcriptional regulator AlpA
MDEPKRGDAEPLDLAELRQKRGCALPLSLPPRGLSRVQAAGYIGISPSLFDVAVADGRMPRPVCINSRRVWDRAKIDEAFDELSAAADQADEDWQVAA